MLMDESPFDTPKEGYLFEHVTRDETVVILKYLRPYERAAGETFGVYLVKRIEDAACSERYIEARNWHFRGYLGIGGSCVD